jgi:uncharacterized protein Yka (UPF0111/DUF47 family)
MSDENSTPNEDQSEEEPQQQLIPAIEEVKGATKPSTRAIRLATVSRLLDKHTTQLDKVGQKFQPLQRQMDRISKMVQPIQKQIKTIEKQTDLIKQMQSQLKQLQKQMSEVQKENQKVRPLLLSNKKNKYKSPTKNKRRGTRRTN